jgi:hypothetical protein
MGLEYVKLNNGNYKFVHAEPAVISNKLNQQLAALIEDAEAHGDDSPSENHPYNATWCLSEARALLSAWKARDPERWMRRGLLNVRAGKPVFETSRARNGIQQLKGPFTRSLVKALIRAWHRRHVSLPTQVDHTY